MWTCGELGSSNSRSPNYELTFDEITRHERPAVWKKRWRNWTLHYKSPRWLYFDSGNQLNDILNVIHTLIRLGRKLLSIRICIIYVYLSTVDRVVVVVGIFMPHSKLLRPVVFIFVCEPPCSNLSFQMAHPTFHYRHITVCVLSVCINEHLKLVAWRNHRIMRMHVSVWSYFLEMMMKKVG